MRIRMRMRRTTKSLIVLGAALAILVHFPLTVHANGTLWNQAKVLIMKGGDRVTIDGVDYIACVIHNVQGTPIGTYLTPVAALDLDGTITLATQGGALSGTFGSILTAGIFTDGTYEILDDPQNGKKYFVFSGTTRVGAPGDWVGTGELQGVKNIIWRCKFELEVDENGEIVIDEETGGPKLVACFYCVYVLVFDEVPT